MLCGEKGELFTIRWYWKCGLNFSSLYRGVSGFLKPGFKYLVKQFISRFPQPLHMHVQKPDSTITKKLPDVWDPKTTHENVFKTVSHRKNGNNYLV